MLVSVTTFALYAGLGNEITPEKAFYCSRYSCSFLYNISLCLYLIWVTYGLCMGYCPFGMSGLSWDKNTSTVNHI